MPTDLVIAADRLSRTFVTGPRRRRRHVDAVVDVSLHVRAGERLAFIGPNGAGKSTSIKMLTGVLTPTSGSAEVLGMVPWERRRDLARRIGSVFGQRSQLWAELPARQTYAMLGAIHGLSDGETRERVAWLGDLLEATALFDQPVRRLSLGQRMRCELAASLLHRPEMLLLDEPTIGLDIVAKRRFRDLLVRLNTEQGTTIVLTSHDVTDVERVADRVVVVNHGRIVHDGAVSDLHGALEETIAGLYEAEEVA